MKSISLTKLLSDFSIYLTAVKGRSQRTKKEYIYDLTLFFRYIKFVNEDKTIDESCDLKGMTINDVQQISIEDMYGFLEYCQTQKNNGANARSRKVSALKTFWSYLFTKRKLLETNISDELEKPKIGARNPIFLSYEETLKFLDGIPKSKHYYRNICICTLFLNCGLRISELCGLSLNDINDDYIKVIGKGNKERFIPLNDVCKEAINVYKREERCNVKSVKDIEALFLSQMGTRITTRSVELIIKKINLNSINKSGLTPHKLRHTMATLLYQQGNVDIRTLQQLLGHENISTTEIYTHVSSKQTIDAINNNPLNIIQKNKAL